MTTPIQEQEEAFKAFQTIFVEMAEQQEREITERKAAARTDFFCAIPEPAKTVYIHLSHKIPQEHPFVRQLQTNYGMDNVLVTIAPPTSGQSFYDNHLDKIAAEEKRKRVIEPFENFSAKKGIDAVIYLCNYLCDGYQGPYFPDQISTQWHIWPAIKVAEQLQKPLIVGGQDIDHCYSGTMGVECYEREYLTGITRNGLASCTKERVQCPTKVVKIY